MGRGIAGSNIPGGFGASTVFNPGGGGGGNGFGNFFSGLGDVFGSKGFEGALDLGSLALGGFGLSKSIGFEEDKLDLLQTQQENAAKAQNFSLANALSLQQQTTRPGTPEHAAVLKAQAEGTFQAA